MNTVDKYLIEGGDDLRRFADNVTRLLAGDKLVALNNLKKIDFDFDFGSLEPEKYNNAYKRLYKAIFTTLQKELRDMML